MVPLRRTTMEPWRQSARKILFTQLTNGGTPDKEAQAIVDVVAQRAEDLFKKNDIRASGPKPAARVRLQERWARGARTARGGPPGGGLLRVGDRRRSRCHTAGTRPPRTRGLSTQIE